jgi:phosphatidylserine/phosphatidylglycerophosphate/cardiolipin synthase-like enzyme
MAETGRRSCCEQFGYFVRGPEFFPAEKKVRHSIRADCEVGDDTFVRTMGHLLGSPLLEGNQITPLENGDHIFPAMLKAIRSAQRTITFENFLFREGEVSDAFAQALAERARSFNFKFDFSSDFRLQGNREIVGIRIR